MARGDTDISRRGTRRRTGWTVRFVLSLGVLGILTVPGTQAAWTDPAAVSGARFSTGTVDLKVNDVDGSSTYAGLDLVGMEPGDSAAAILTVTNSGNTRLNYYADATNPTSMATSLVAKVTADQATNGSTCASAAMPGTTSTFAAGLVGSASSPRQLAAGNTEKLCIQATLPSNADALGGTATITFRFRASTGASGTGWTDDVSLSGTSMSALNALYLGTDGPGDRTTPPQGLPLRRTAPTATTLYNYDTTRDPWNPGLYLTRGSSQYWYFTVDSTPFTINSPIKLRIWSAAGDFSTTASGGLQLNLLDCTATLSCTSVYSPGPTFTASPWNSDASKQWVGKTFTIPAPPATSYTWQPGKLFVLQVTAATGPGNGAMMLAYDTTSYKSALILP